MESWQVERRADAARYILGAVFLVLGVAFFRAQVLNHEQYKLEAAGNRLRQIPLQAPRGEILDRNGLPITENIPGYSIRLLASDEDSLRAVLVRLTALIQLDSLDVDQVVRRWKTARYQPVLVFASGRDTTVAVLEEHRTLLPGLVIQSEPRREYPLTTGVAHLVGYVGELSPDDTIAGARPGDLVGKEGLEAAYDTVLRGRTGVHFIEVTAKGRTLGDKNTAAAIPPLAGNQLHTTIDLPLQRFIDSMWRTDLPGKRGSLLAMTPDGKILAYYSQPSYDPNDFIRGMNSAEYRLLADDPGRPFYNRVVSAAYPPASPFKLAIAAMALKRGLVTMDSRMPEPCTGGYRFGNRVFKCWKHDGSHGSLTLAQAIARSCDVYFYQLGRMLKKDALLEDGAALGFRLPTGVDMIGERSSRFPAVKDYVNSRGVSTWSEGEILNLSIGQGRNVQTLINMVAFYAALAGDGKKPVPYVVKPRAGAVGHDLGLSPEILAGIRDALRSVVQGGTAAASGGAALDVAGKTGTGQVTGQKDIGWFIGFAPASAPRIVVGIAVEEGLHGSSVAAYAVRAMAAYLKVAPGAVKIEVTEDTARTSISDTLPVSAPRGRGGRGGR